MTNASFAALNAEIAALRRAAPVGRVAEIGGGTVQVAGLSAQARLGDMVSIHHRDQTRRGEVLAMTRDRVTILPDGVPDGLAIDDRVTLQGAATIAPDDSWVGRVIDPFGQPLDGRSLLRGCEARMLQAAPPAATMRRGLGPRLETGLAVFNTLLPLVRGQRIGLFAGSGVGKSTLLSQLARG
ncbi:flagellum-specific ATP synthase FliI, partial [Escherichia coli]|nr:flagellum-specific ATP synthase FliI [Escherichia coli]